MRGIIGRKVGMTQLYDHDGMIVPVTVVEVKVNQVLQRKTKEVDGYEAIQLGFGDRKKSKQKKTMIGHAKKYESETVSQIVREFRDMKIDEGVKTLSPSVFKQGDKVDVKGISKGKGFAGAIKRHGHSRGPMGHGSGYHRGHGSSGAVAANRVFPGLKMPGRMGYDNCTTQNLTVMRVSDEEGYILISGAVPGPKKGYVLIREALKKPGKNTGITLLDIKLNREKQELIEEAKRFNIKVTADMTNEDISKLINDAKEKEEKGGK